MASPHSDDEAITSELPEERSRHLDLLEPAAVIRKRAAEHDSNSSAAKKGGTADLAHTGRFRPFGTLRPDRTVTSRRSKDTRR